jgi:hypothetical protein
VPHAHPPSTCRRRADVTEGGNRPVRDPRDVQDLMECGPTRSRPPSHANGLRFAEDMIENRPVPRVGIVRKPNTFPVAGNRNSVVISAVKSKVFPEGRWGGTPAHLRRGERHKGYLATESQ